MVIGMSDQRIDSISRTDASGWGAAARQSSNGHSPLQLINGHSERLPSGMVLRGLVEKTDHGALMVTLNGEKLIFKGLPASLLGKQVDFILQPSSGQPPTTRLFWVGISSNQQAQPTTRNNTQIPVTTTTPAALPTASGVTKPVTLQDVLTAGKPTLAVIDSILSDGRMQLKLEGLLLEAPAPPAGSGSIKAGDGLMVKLDASGDTILQILAVHRDLVGKVHHLLRQQAIAGSPVAELLTALTQSPGTMQNPLFRNNPLLAALSDWLTQATINQAAPLDGKRLAGMMQQSGLMLEHNLLDRVITAASTTAKQHPASLSQDLKAIMLTAGVEPQSSHPLHHILSGIAAPAQARIEATQLLNILAQIHQEPVRIELPMLAYQQLVNVQLSIEQQPDQHHTDDGQTSGNTAGYNILIALEMTKLGKLRIDARITEHTIRARIYYQQADAGMRLRSDLKRLESRLQSLGFDQPLLVVTHGIANEESNRRFEQLEQMKPASTSLLDITV